MPNGYTHHMQMTAPNLTTGFPRSGRTMLGQWSWLARLADKVRAAHAGTNGDYIAYCGLSMGFLDRAGISEGDFDKLVRDGASDADLEHYLDTHVDAAQRDSANIYVLDEQVAHLDKQDAEEDR